MNCFLRGPFGRFNFSLSLYISFKNCFFFQTNITLLMVVLDRIPCISEHLLSSQASQAHFAHHPTPCLVTMGAPLIMLSSRQWPVGKRELTLFLHRGSTATLCMPWPKQRYIEMGLPPLSLPPVGGPGVAPCPPPIPPTTSTSPPICPTQ